jgi:hypothetical protein
MNLTTMIGAPARQMSGGSMRGECRDVLIDTAQARIVHAVFDVPWGFSSRYLVVPAQRLEWADGEWSLDIKDADVEGERTEDGGSSDTSVEIGEFPPVIVGPFGYTVAPMMAGALINSMNEDAVPVAPTPEVTETPEGHWLNRLKGLPLFDTTGALGTLVDIVVDPAGLDCISFTADSERGQRAAFPFDSMRHVAKDGSSIVLELSASPQYSARALSGD